MSFVKNTPIILVCTPMKDILQYYNPTRPKPIPSPLENGRLWGPPDDHEWIKLTISEEHDRAFYLFTLYTNGWLADSWHESIEEAKQQAKYGFDVDENVWEDCPDE